MIVRAITGKSFRGLVAYLFDGAVEGTEDKRAVRIGGNVAGNSVGRITAEFHALRQLRPTLGKAVAHFSLSLSPDDREVSDAEFALIAEKFLAGMGFEQVPYLLVRHLDTDHPHLHIVASRVRIDNGKAVSDKNNFKRAEAVARQLEAEFGLIRVESSRPAPNSDRKGDTMRIDDIIPPRERRRPRVDTQTWSVAPADDAPPTKDAERELRRAVFEPDWIEALRLLYRYEVKAIRKQGWGLEVQLRNGGKVKDFGNRIVAERLPEDEAAQKVIAAARAKGWSRLTFTGSDAFVRAAMAESLACGLEPVPSDGAQALILAELIQSSQGGAVALAPRATASPAAQPHLQPSTRPGHRPGTG